MPHRKPIDHSALAAKLGHVFHDPSMLRAALTHPSLSGAKARMTSSAYERLEFLGDRVLGLIIAHWLYELYPQAEEGELAKRHASLVNRDILKDIAHAIHLEEHLLLASGGEANAPRKNLAALSDATEGVIGALYLDGGLAVAEQFIKRYWETVIKTVVTPADPKTALQEFVQGRGWPLPVYKIVERTGPPHAPRFKIEVQVKGHPPMLAEGGSKREAEKVAAQLMLLEIEKA